MEIANVGMVLVGMVPVGIVLVGMGTCYQPTDTSELAPPNPSQTGWYSIYLPRRDGRLS